MINKTMKTFLVMTLCLMGMIMVNCSNEAEVNISNLQGKWSECYDDPNFSFDSSVIYEFKGDEKSGTYTIISSSPLDPSGREYVTTGAYIIEDGLLDLNALSSEWGTPRYRIGKLSNSEMEWQKEGTTYSPGTMASDYKHFVRISGN